MFHIVFTIIGLSIANPTNKKWNMFIALTVCHNGLNLYVIDFFGSIQCHSFVAFLISLCKLQANYYSGSQFEYDG